MLTTVVCAMGLSPALATAEDTARHGGGSGGGVTVVARGLNGPFELSDGPGRSVYVTEADAGQVTAVDLRSGAVRPVVTGLPGPAGAVRVGRQFVIVTGAASGPPDEPAASAPAAASSAAHASAADPSADDLSASVLVARAGQPASRLADLTAYELANNPDGQQQFDPETGQPLDALSNPFYVLNARRGFALVADGGANAVLAVSRTGKVSNFFVPPTVNTGACKDLPNNDAAHPGCDSVPTGLAYGPHNTLYVSALTADVPGEGRVYVLDARTGKQKRVIKGFTAPTGVAVDPYGNIYVSEALEGAPEGEPPADFDPSTIGRIVKVSCDGRRSAAQVTMPTGLLWQDGALYSSAWSVAGLFLGIPDAGQVVKVAPSAFRRI